VEENGRRRAKYDHVLARVEVDVSDTLIAHVARAVGVDLFPKLALIVRVELLPLPI